MDFFMPEERVLYDRSYYFSDQAEKDCIEVVAELNGVDIDAVASSSELMDEVHDRIRYAIDSDLQEEICNFDSMLRELKAGGDPDHPAEISVVAKGSVGRWDGSSRELVVSDSLLSLVSGTGSADVLEDCLIDRIIDTNGELRIDASHHDGFAYLDVRLISGVSLEADGFKLGGEYCTPGKMSPDLFFTVLDTIYDAADVGPCSLPRFAERAYGAARKSYRFGETTFYVFQVDDSPCQPYKVMISTDETSGKDAGIRFASTDEAKAWCYRYSMEKLADAEKKPEPSEAAAAAKKAAVRSGGDGAGNAGSIKL